MPVPYFYIPVYNPEQTLITLEEASSRHIVQVLRMKPGSPIQLTDGRGNLLTAVVEEDNKKKCIVRLQDINTFPADLRKITIGISLLKNTSRFEWFLEKAAELGINEIIPLICERTEKQQFRYERMKSILVSAMLQSRQSWMTLLKEPARFTRLFPPTGFAQKFIAHCTESAKVSLADAANGNMDSQIILIGPEGDFTKEEIEAAVQDKFVAVNLGETRLRSETAGLVAATLLKMS
jgi:16S rRNA (uracil1498-N3)-methyltransferase